MFWPGEISVFLHNTIDTTNLTKEDVPALRKQVKETIEKPVEEFLAGLAETPPQPAEQEVIN
jgi:hypothetical protein